MKINSLLLLLPSIPKKRNRLCLRSSVPVVNKKTWIPNSTLFLILDSGFSTFFFLLFLYGLWYNRLLIIYVNHTRLVPVASCKKVTVHWTEEEEEEEKIHCPKKIFAAKILIGPMSQN